MKVIELTQGQVAKVDDQWFEYLNQWKWYACWNNHTKSYYARRNEGKFPNQKTIKMHRVVMDTPKGLICDHRNHDTLDNQEENLRNITNSQNLMNRRKYNSNNPTKEKNISRRLGGFYVRVKKDSVLVFSKWFKHLDEAIVARNAAVKEFHGEFGHIAGQE